MGQPTDGQRASKRAPDSGVIAVFTPDGAYWYLLFVLAITLLVAVGYLFVFANATFSF